MWISREDRILSEIDQAEQRQGRPAASSSSTSNTADELDMLSTAELQSRLREVRACVHLDLFGCVSELIWRRVGADSRRMARSGYTITGWRDTK